jgi:hypothetical protein
MLTSPVSPPRIAAAAINTPDRITVAALGPRVDRGHIGLALGQCSFQFAFTQVVVLRDVHHHKPVFAPHRNRGLGLAGQNVFDGGHAAHFQVVGCELIHGEGSR